MRVIKRRCHIQKWCFLITYLQWLFLVFVPLSPPVALLKNTIYREKKGQSHGRNALIYLLLPTLFYYISVKCPLKKKKKRNFISANTTKNPGQTRCTYIYSINEVLVEKDRAKRRRRNKYTVIHFCSVGYTVNKWTTRCLDFSQSVFWVFSLSLILYQRTAQSALNFYVFYDMYVQCRLNSLLFCIYTVE